MLFSTSSKKLIVKKKKRTVLSFRIRFKLKSGLFRSNIQTKLTILLLYKQYLISLYFKQLTSFNHNTYFYPQYFFLTL